MFAAADEAATEPERDGVRRDLAKKHHRNFAASGHPPGAASRRGAAYAVATGAVPRSPPFTATSITRTSFTEPITSSPPR